MLVRDAQPGPVTWIGVRPERLGAVVPLERVFVGESGLEGDHARPGKRAVTLFQHEHLATVASFTGGEVRPEDLRRNIHVAGLNLAALRGARVRLGAALLEITGVCAPCSRMQAALGPGGYNALRGHGGWCARVLDSGAVALGDRVVRETLPTPELGVGAAIGEGDKVPPGHN